MSKTIAYLTLTGLALVQSTNVATASAGTDMLRGKVVNPKYKLPTKSGFYTDEDGFERFHDAKSAACEECCKPGCSKDCDEEMLAQEEMMEERNQACCMKGCNENCDEHCNKDYEPEPEFAECSSITDPEFCVEAGYTSALKADPGLCKSALCGEDDVQQCCQAAAPEEEGDDEDDEDEDVEG